MFQIESRGPISGSLSIPLRGLFLIAVLSLGPPLLAQPAQTEADRLDQLEQEVVELKALLESLQNKTPSSQDATQHVATQPAANSSSAMVEELARRIDLLAEDLETIRLGETRAKADRSDHGYGPAASKVYRSQPGISLGGYGEFLYESFSSTRDNGNPSGKHDKSDALRAIIYFGYKFNDNWLFNSEIEFEHAGSEVAVEFAYLDRLVRPEFNLRGGHLLVPMGFVNELHEPPVFLGAKRPQIERVIMPSTWHENGFGLFGDLGQLTYRSYIMTGLEASGFSAGGIRGGRQKGAKALSDDLAWVTRVDYSPTPGVLLGGSAYLGDSGQGIASATGETLDVNTEIFELHAEFKWRGLEARLLVTEADLGDITSLNQALGLTGASSIGENLEGWYLQAGYDVFSRFEMGNRQLTPYVRWEQFNTQASVPNGFTANPVNDQEILTFGLDYKPIAPIVIKLDYQDLNNAAGTGIDQFNLAVGYIF